MREESFKFRKIRESWKNLKRSKFCESLFSNFPLNRNDGNNLSLSHLDDHWMLPNSTFMLAPAESSVSTATDGQLFRMERRVENLRRGIVESLCLPI